MNQSIQIIDGFEYSDRREAIKMTAMNSGQLIHCYITGLQKQDVFAFYKEYQFDIEEILAERISEEMWDDSGEVWIDAEDIKGS
ncbi:DUF1488 domain-containing protein [Aestuariibacter sp. AA17]|uniref:DUF1488 domain-containing protein n=1 Tax=Fluctibacter corallii TaxID=2984329 RepID=A0ABT3AEA9_9ALTE|nr:DUF1488 domain-containing protein [Aestuariibacter sp. AA17]MCV2886576.1 DUF1488 domain-containing protein [Aestuariibacter sp. AA17]